MHPLEYIRGLLGVKVLIELRDGQKYKGSLRMYDEHLNVLLSGVENGKPQKTLFLRGDSIFFIAEAA
ncbi:small nuclear ribonucleoprotein [Nematocida sp. LUAm3]|nr:small nuclear ribonucleoprotein [Nematocida sp. LUAm3]KAI5174473.1 small nuclear ribonucleoprotein [Nematocida sp. LUAm2]KAI5179128.1 small nuclear ribonucleoprotein [Nematocida sp. LUAm1]